METTEVVTDAEARVFERALLARDPRFDGRFFVGVVTTGIYCRPVCPAPRALRRNVRFFPTAAAAAEAGLRPCRRCRPEAAPGTPAWIGTSAVVHRALRLLGEGALDDGNVEDLALRVGVTPRHLHRLFVTHLGASPVAVAQTRRLHFAKRLIDETPLAMTEVAVAAGYASLRRFNAAFRQAYRTTPSALRRSGTAPDVPAGELRLRLAYRPPYDWDALLDFLRPRATPGVECVGAACYRRTIDLDGRVGSLAVSHAPETRSIELRLHFPDAAALSRIVARVRRLFDLGADPAEVVGVLGHDPRLAALVKRRPGLRVPGAWDGFEVAVRAILGQQVSVRAATTLCGRLAAAFGTPVADPQPGLTTLFPTPQRLAEADVAGIGLPRSRAEAVRHLAAAVCRGTIGLDAPTTSTDDIRWRLAALPGIGAWTAEYVALRLSEPDAFPASDLVLRRAAAAPAGPFTPAQMASRAEAWRPWRAYAALHLWRSEA